MIPVSDPIYSFYSTLVMQGLVLVGAGIILVFQGVQTYVIDSYSLHSASGTFQGRRSPDQPLTEPLMLVALAATFFLRSLADLDSPCSHRTCSDPLAAV